MNQEVRRLRVVNWDHYQHYKDRRPPWIKLHVELLDDYEFTRLDQSSRLLAVCMMLLAAKTGNHIPGDPSWIANVLHLGRPVDVVPLVSAGFLETCDCERCSASNLLATCPTTSESALDQRQRQRRDRGETEGVPPEPPARSDADIAPERVFMVKAKRKGDPTEWVLPDGKAEEWAATYTAVDVSSELRIARQWCIDNPVKRKTAKGMPHFLNGWLERRQNRGGGSPASVLARQLAEEAALAAARQREDRDPHAPSRHGMKAVDGRIWCSRAGGWVDASEWRPLDERA